MKNKTPSWAIITGILMLLIGTCGLKNDISYINIDKVTSIADNIIKEAERSEDVAQDSEIVTDSLTDAQSTQQEIQSPIIDTIVTDTSATTQSDTAIQDLIVTEDDEVNELKEFTDSFLHISAEAKKVMVNTGYMGLIFSIGFFIAGIFMFVKKPFSINLALGVLIANILFTIYRWVHFTHAELPTMYSIANKIGSGVCIFTSVILIIIIYSSDKSAYSAYRTIDE